MRIFQVDAFTRTRFTGNPATVVLDAEDLDESTHAAIAREFPHAETAFVSRGRAHDHDVRVRFFNARKEAPFVGHATIAAHAVLLALGERSTGALRQHSGTGIIEVRATQSRGKDGPATLIEFRQSVSELGPPLELKSTLRIAAALQLPAGELHPVLPARIARKGATRLLLPVAGPQALERLAPRFDALIELGAQLGAEGFFVFALAPGAGAGAGSLSSSARMFCPALGIPEDPVSGNAHAMLASYLFERGELGRGRGLAFTGHQGAQVGRPGEVSVRLELEDERLAAVHIGGSAVIVSAGTLER
jgi:PhzF family phenazine biosynthesis protein